MIQPLQFGKPPQNERSKVIFDADALPALPACGYDAFAKATSFYPNFAVLDCLSLPVELGCEDTGAIIQMIRELEYFSH